MTEYTPTTEEVRSLYKSGAWLMTDRAPNKFDREEYEGVLFGEFDRWLNEIRAEAWDEGHTSGLDTGLTIAENVHENGGVLDIENLPGPEKNPYRPNEK